VFIDKFHGDLKSKTSNKVKSCVEEPEVGQSMMQHLPLEQQ